MDKPETFGTTLKILVVEDSPDLQTLLCGMLGEIPCVEVVAFVKTEAAALQALREQRADLAIVDLELEEGTGLGILKEVNQTTDLQDKLKIVVFSNYSNVVIRHRCLSLGAEAFFDKSFQIDDLLEFVNTQASGRTQSPL